MASAVDRLKEVGEALWSSFIAFTGPWVTWAVEAVSRYLMKELGTRLVDFAILVGLAIAVTRMQTILIPWLWFLIKKGWWYITLILACIGNLSFLIWLYYRTYTPQQALSDQL